MSTKIYNGVRFKAKTLSEIIKQLHKVSEDAVKNTVDLFKQNDFYFNLLYHVAKKYEKENNSTIDSSFELGLALQDILKKSDNPFPLLFNVTIFENKGIFYGIYFDDSNNNYKLLFDNDIVEDFHYQDQSDRPENISNEEWDERCEVWEEIFDEISPAWVPSEAGVTYEIIKPDSFLLALPREIIEKIKNFENNC